MEVQKCAQNVNDKLLQQDKIVCISGSAHRGSQDSYVWHETVPFSHQQRPVNTNIHAYMYVCMCVGHVMMTCWHVAKGDVPL